MTAWSSKGKGSATTSGASGAMDSSQGFSTGFPLTAHRAAKSCGEVQRRFAEGAYIRDAAAYNAQDKRVSASRRKQHCGRCRLHGAVVERRRHVCPHAACTCAPCAKHRIMTTVMVARHRLARLNLNLLSCESKKAKAAERAVVKAALPVEVTTPPKTQKKKSIGTRRFATWSRKQRAVHRQRAVPTKVSRLPMRTKRASKPDNAVSSAPPETTTETTHSPETAAETDSRPIGASLYSLGHLCRRCWRHGVASRYWQVKTSLPHKEVCRWRECLCALCRDDARLRIAVRYLQAQVEVPVGAANAPITFEVCKWRVTYGAAMAVDGVRDAASTSGIAAVPGLSAALLPILGRTHCEQQLAPPPASGSSAMPSTHRGPVVKLGGPDGARDADDAAAGSTIEDFVLALRRWAARKVGVPFDEDFAEPARPPAQGPSSPGVRDAEQAEVVKCEPDISDLLSADVKPLLVAEDVETDMKGLPVTDDNDAKAPLDLSKPDAAPTFPTVRAERPPEGGEPTGPAPDQRVLARLSICLECDAVVDTESLLSVHCCRMEAPPATASTAMTMPPPPRPRRRARRKKAGATSATETAPCPASAQSVIVHTSDVAHPAPSGRSSPPPRKDSHDGEVASARITCADCGDLEFPSRVALLEHRVERHAGRHLPRTSPKRSPAPCLLCPAQGPAAARHVMTPLELDEHTLRAHGGRGAVACPKCFSWLRDFDAVSEHLQLRHGLKGCSIAPPLAWACCRQCRAEKPDLPAMQLHQEQHMQVVPLARLEFMASLLQEVSVAYSLDARDAMSSAVP